MQTFFKRLLQLSENKGFKNLNDFALNGLGYDSSSKLNRLKDETKKPSVEIIEDIANKFEDLDLRWFLLGEGKMLREIESPIENNNVFAQKIHLLEEQNELLKENRVNKDEIIKLYKEKIDYLESILQRGKDDKSQTA